MVSLPINEPYQSPMSVFMKKPWFNMQPIECTLHIQWTKSQVMIVYWFTKRSTVYIQLDDDTVAKYSPPRMTLYYPVPEHVITYT